MVKDMKFNTEMALEHFFKKEIYFYEIPLVT